jgi:hypothetical protein
MLSGVTGEKLLPPCVPDLVRAMRDRPFEAACGQSCGDPLRARGVAADWHGSSLLDVIERRLMDHHVPQRSVMGQVCHVVIPISDSLSMDPTVAQLCAQEDPRTRTPHAYSMGATLALHLAGAVEAFYTCHGERHDVVSYVTAVRRPVGAQSMIRTGPNVLAYILSVGAANVEDFDGDAPRSLCTYVSDWMCTAKSRRKPVLVPRTATTRAVPAFPWTTGARGVPSATTIYRTALTAYVDAFGASRSSREWCVFNVYANAFSATAALGVLTSVIQSRGLDPDAVLAANRDAAAMAPAVVMTGLPSPVWTVCGALYHTCFVSTAVGDVLPSEAYARMTHDIMSCDLSAGPASKAACGVYHWVSTMAREAYSRSDVNQHGVPIGATGMAARCAWYMRREQLRHMIEGGDTQMAAAVVSDFEACVRTFVSRVIAAYRVDPYGGEGSVDSAVGHHLQWVFGERTDYPHAGSFSIPSPVYVYDDGAVSEQPPSERARSVEPRLFVSQAADPLLNMARMLELLAMAQSHPVTIRLMYFVMGPSRLDGGLNIHVNLISEPGAGKDFLMRVLKQMFPGCVVYISYMSPRALMVGGERSEGDARTLFRSEVTIHDKMHPEDPATTAARKELMTQGMSAVRRPTADPDSGKMTLEKSVVVSRGGSISNMNNEQVNERLGVVDRQLRIQLSYADASKRPNKDIIATGEAGIHEKVRDAAIVAGRALCMRVVVYNLLNHAFMNRFAPDMTATGVLINRICAEYTRRTAVKRTTRDKERIRTVTETVATMRCLSLLDRVYTSTECGFVVAPADDTPPSVRQLPDGSWVPDVPASLLAIAEGRDVPPRPTQSMVEGLMTLMSTPVVVCAADILAAVSAAEPHEELGTAGVHLRNIGSELSRAGPIVLPAPYANVRDSTVFVSLQSAVLEEFESLHVSGDSTGAYPPVTLGDVREHEARNGTAWPYLRHAGSMRVRDKAAYLPILRDIDGDLTHVSLKYTRYYYNLLSTGHDLKSFMSYLWTSYCTRSDRQKVHVLASLRFLSTRNVPNMQYTHTGEPVLDAYGEHRATVDESGVEVMSPVIGLLQRGAAHEPETIHMIPAAWFSDDTYTSSTLSASREADLEVVIMRSAYEASTREPVTLHSVAQEVVAQAGVVDHVTALTLSAVDDEFGALPYPAAVRISPRDATSAARPNPLARESTTQMAGWRNGYEVLASMGDVYGARTAMTDMGHGDERLGIGGDVPFDAASAASTRSFYGLGVYARERLALCDPTVDAVLVRAYARRVLNGVNYGFRYLVPTRGLSVFDGAAEHTPFLRSPIIRYPAEVRDVFAASMLREKSSAELVALRSRVGNALPTDAEFDAVVADVYAKHDYLAPSAADGMTVAGHRLSVLGTLLFDADLAATVLDMIVSKHGLSVGAARLLLSDTVSVYENTSVVSDTAAGSDASSDDGARSVDAIVSAAVCEDSLSMEFQHFTAWRARATTLRSVIAAANDVTRTTVLSGVAVRLRELLGGAGQAPAAKRARTMPGGTSDLSTAAGLVQSYLISGIVRSVEARLGTEPASVTTCEEVIYMCLHY